MTRLLVALIAGTIVFAAVYASAASVSVSSKDLGAGDTAVSKCDADGFTTLEFTTNASNEITQVTIGDIDPACIGGTMTVNLVSNGGAAVGKGSAPVVDTPATPEETVTVTIDTPASTDIVLKVAMQVLGP